MNHGLRYLFFLCVVRPLIAVVLGLNVRHRERLPRGGPAIVVANHNSHLDTLVLMSLFPPRMLCLLRPVAAADYFLRNRFLAWFSTRIVGIIPIARQLETYHEDRIAPAAEALQRGAILILYPEGTRAAEPEHLQGFKTGIAHLAKRNPAVPIYPVFLYGLGKALPKGEALLVPFFVDVFVGEPLTWEQAGADRPAFMNALAASMKALAAEGHLAGKVA